MRTKNLALATGALLAIAGCAGTQPKSPVPKLGADDLAVFQGGRITRGDWDLWKKSSRIPENPEAGEEARAFQEYLNFKLHARAAALEGLTADSMAQKRWASVRLRILAEHYRTEVIDGQYGVDDTTIARYLKQNASKFANVPADSARATAARTIALQGSNIDSLYEARKEHFVRDSVQLPLDSVRTQLESSVLREKSMALTKAFPDMMKEKYGLKVAFPERPAPSEDSLRAAYQKAVKAGQFLSPAIFHMKALGSKDSASLSKALASVQTVEAFQALSSKFPVGTPVAAPKGDLGRVKRQFAIPYGLGMVPQLFNELDPPRLGLVSPLKINDTLWVAFWINGVDSGKVRSFEDSREEVLTTYTRENPWTPAPSAALVTWDKGVVATQADLDLLYQEIPAHMKRQYPPQRVIDFMTLWAVVARAAEESGLASRPEIQTSLRDKENVFWAQEWSRTPAFETFGLPKKTIDSALAAWSPRFRADTWLDTAGVNRDGARLAVMPSRFLEGRFAEEMDKYRTDSSFQAIDSVLPELFRDVRSDLDKIGHEKQDSVLRAKVGLKLAPAAPGNQPPLSAAVRMDSARALHDRRQLAPAQALYESIESDAKAPDSLRAQALFQLGQLYGEQQSFPRSLSRYRAVLSRFPASSEAYKARFMIAFTYSEYLKLDKIALQEFRKVLADYPKCDLADDADWMIRNIESGGALMPKFDDLDSTGAVSDSLAPATKAPEAPAAPVSTAKKSSAKAAPAAAVPAKK
ncbi:MAG: hypothetical protein H6686_05030 [Fibrobacteria bacterium]|nr:hypothetical protein [Fibrobacteria bacterium]